MSVQPASSELRRPLWLERRNAGMAALRHGLDDIAVARLERILAVPRRFEKGRALYRANAPATSIFVIQSGAFKSVAYLATGRTQITGLHIVGDILGLTGLAEGTQPEDAIAVEYSQVAPVPLADLTRLAMEIPPLQHNVSRVLGAAIARTKRALLLLGHRNADERLAFFLLDLSRRLRLAGYSPVEFLIPLTNNDVANMAGMTGETVSRLLRTMQERGLIDRTGRRVRILDIAALERLAGMPSEAAPSS